MVSFTHNQRTAAHQSFSDIIGRSNSFAYEGEGDHEPEIRKFMDLVDVGQRDDQESDRKRTELMSEHMPFLAF